MRMGEKLKELVRKASTVVGWRTVSTVAVLTACVAFVPLRARGQFGLDPCCAIISTGLNTISGLLKNVVAKPLASIQQIQQQTANFEQQVIYPVSAITSAQALAGQLHTQLSKLSQFYRLPTHSATLPAPQRLEQVLLSHDPQRLDQVSQNYSLVYGNVIPPADAPEGLRNMVDMSDAEAQAALKKAVELDALADIEIAAADQINQQLQTAAPGSAPILQAQTAAWLVRANAYTQSATAELIRIRSIDLANTVAQLKLSAGDTNALWNGANQSLRRSSH